MTHFEQTLALWEVEESVFLDLRSYQPLKGTFSHLVLKHSSKFTHLNKTNVKSVLNLLIWLKVTTFKQHQLIFLSLVFFWLPITCCLGLLAHKFIYHQPYFQSHGAGFRKKRCGT